MLAATWGDDGRVGNGTDGGIVVGATIWSITFETGVLMAYRAAASIARMIAMRFLSLDILLIGIYPSDNPARIAYSH